jgi:hypothetical protein
VNAGAAQDKIEPATRRRCARKLLCYLMRQVEDLTKSALGRCAVDTAAEPICEQATVDVDYIWILGSTLKAKFWGPRSCADSLVELCHSYTACVGSSCVLVSEEVS